MVLNFTRRKQGILSIISTCYSCSIFSRPPKESLYTELFFDIGFVEDEGKFCDEIAAARQAAKMVDFSWS